MDAKIEPGAAVLQIPKVVGQFLANTFEISIRGKLHLGESCQAGTNQQPQAIVTDRQFEFADKFGPLRARTNQAHFALEDVPKLRQLIEMSFAKKSADGGD